MNEPQSFRLIGRKEIVTIPVQYVDGQSVVSWEIIEQVFPGVQCVKNGNDPVPRFIKYEPDAILNVVLSSAPGSIRVDSSAPTVGATGTQTDPSSDPSSEDALVENLRVASAISDTPISDIGTCRSSTGPLISPSCSPSTVKTTSRNVLSFREVVRLASKKAHESDGQIYLQDLGAKMERMLKLQEAFDRKQEAFDAKQVAFDAKQEQFSQLQNHSLAQQHEMEQLQLQDRELQKAMQQLALDHHAEIKQLAFDHHKEIKQLQIQALGQLAVLKARVDALLTQTYELHEYPIPRLFVVLPQDCTRWRAMDPFSNKFRLYFMCECGEHSKAIDSNTEIHFAKHEGYQIARPNEFFQAYGSHVFAILKMLKLGISVAGVAVPAISHLVRPDAIDQATSYLQILKDIEPMMDPVVDWLDKVATDEGETVDEFSKQMKNKEALAGADLRKLSTFLKTKDGDSVLGNLYRTVTDAGHVKWVCIDHYRENYQESTAKDFQRMLDSLGGSFDKTIGRVEVVLRSKVLADQFSLVLGRARSVYELDVNFDWACTTSDLEVLEGALKNSRVAILRLGIRQFQLSNRSFASTQYGAIFRIKGFPNMRMLHVILSKDVAKLLSIQSSTPYCKLSIEVVPGLDHAKETADIAEALKTNSTLTTLDLKSSAIWDDRAVALIEELKAYPIGDNGARALAEALKINSTLTTLILKNNGITDDGAEALAEVLHSNSTLVTLDLARNAIRLKGLLAFLELRKTNSLLTALDLGTNSFGDNAAQALAKAFKTNSALTDLDLTSSSKRQSLKFDGAKVLAEALKTSLTLTALNLTGNSIGFEGANVLAEALKTNSTLTTLDLRSNSIGCDGAKALAEALTATATLPTLGLRSNSIGYDGAKALAEALKTNATLTTLDLAVNSIGLDGAKALAEALKFNSTLTTLDLNDNSFGSEGAEALAEALKSNSGLTTLDLRDNVIESAGAKALAEILMTNTTLTTLNLRSNYIEDSGVMMLAESLKSNSTLTSLDLHNNSITDDAAKTLAEALQNNSALTVLNLSYNSIGHDGAKALAKALKTNSTLNTLDLWGNSIGSDGVIALAEALRANSTLGTLNLASNSIRVEGVKELAEALKTNSTVTTLDLRYNSIGDDGAKALAEALKTNSALTTMDLKSNLLGNEGGKALAEVLKINSTLTALSLSYNRVGEDGAKALAEALETSSTLTTVDW
ncbi:hypothetical protein BGZ67_005993 [Mortierella alpina]|nr:hypothetical protein BGZ67_005993 [Mortierella alpina]